MAGIGMVSAMGPGAANGAIGGAPGWWVVPGKACVAAYQPKGAADYASSKINLATPGVNDAVEGVAPAWAAATGWTFNGINMTLDAGALVPAAGWGLAVRVANRVLPSGNRAISGANMGVWNRFGVGSNADTRVQYADGGQANGVVGALGVNAILAVSGNAGYLNGIFEVAIGAWTIAGGWTLTIGSHWGVYTNVYYAGDIVALSLYSSVLTAGEIAALSARMAAL